MISLVPDFEKVKARAKGPAWHRVVLWVMRPEALVGGLLAFDKGLRELCGIAAGGECTSPIVGCDAWRVGRGAR